MARKNERPQQVRILGGALRGRRIDVPPGVRVRPTAARTREALFNMLIHGGYGPDGGNILAGARVADLFCGTGALAMEALSRGAASALLVDRDHRTLDLARANADRLGLAARCAWLCAALPCPLPGGPFDLVLLDPPYGQALAEPVLAALLAQKAVAPGAIVAVETGSAEALAFPPAFTLMEERTYGAATLRLLSA